MARSPGRIPSRSTAPHPQGRHRSRPSSSASTARRVVDRLRSGSAPADDHQEGQARGGVDGRPRRVGRYYVATPPRPIVAQPGTLTGSIGIYTGKFVIGGTLEKLGASIDGSATGGCRQELAGAALYGRGTGEGRRGHAGVLRRLHLGGGRVAEAGRERCSRSRRGRVWTGRHQGIGLVDELGAWIGPSLLPSRRPRSTRAGRRTRVVPAAQKPDRSLGRTPSGPATSMRRERWA